MSLAYTLIEAVHGQISGTASQWFEQALTQARGPLPQLLRVYTDASRRLGDAALVISVADRPRELGDIPLDQWTLEDAGRFAFLLARHDAFPDSPAENDAAAAACFENGDTREQRSWLRTVALLPRAERFLPIVVDACRTSIVPLFEAVACENTYPARHFPDRNFNQLVLKALFNEIALKRIVGLPTRLNPELARMAADYADERRAAGRSIPVDISYAMMAGPTAQRIHG